VLMSGWKVSIVLLSASTLWVMFAVKKRCVCTHLLTHESMILCSFEHNFPLCHPMRRVYKIVSTARRDDVQVFTKKTRLCTSLSYVDTATCNFWHVRTCLSGKFPLFCPLRTDYEVCSLYNNMCLHNFSTYENMRMCNNQHHTMFSTTFPSTYLNSHATTWLFLTYKSFSISHY